MKYGPGRCVRGYSLKLWVEVKNVFELSFGSLSFGVFAEDTKANTGLNRLVDRSFDDLLSALSHVLIKFKDKGKFIGVDLALVTLPR